MKEALLVIYASPNGRDQWRPVKPDDVPAWVRTPETMGKLVAGEMAMKADEGEKGSDWYRAERVLSDDEKRRIAAAEAKRARRLAKRTVH